MTPEAAECFLFFSSPDIDLSGERPRKHVNKGIARPADRFKIYRGLSNASA